jgi:hypothetical protein
MAKWVLRDRENDSMWQGDIRFIADVLKSMDMDELYEDEVTLELTVED